MKNDTSKTPEKAPEKAPHETPELIERTKEVLVTVSFDGPFPGVKLRNYILTIPANKELTTGEAKFQLEEMKVIGVSLVGPMLVGPAFPRKKKGPVDNPES